MGCQQLCGGEGMLVPISVLCTPSDPFLEPTHSRCDTFRVSQVWPRHAQWLSAMVELQWPFTGLGTSPGISLHPRGVSKSFTKVR